MIEEKYKNLAAMAVSLVKGIERTGIKVTHLKDRYGKLLMPLEGNVNHIGMMYAGSLFTIGELSGGILHGVAFDTHNFYPLVKEVLIRFLAPAMTDVTLEVSMSKEGVALVQKEAEENGKADYILDLEIKDKSEAVVAVVHGTWQIRKIPEELKESLSFF